MTYPIGESQIIAMPGTPLSLMLAKERFLADGDESIGYTRDYVSSQLAETEATLAGTSAIKASQFYAKLTFSWSLLLTEAEMLMLSAIVEHQQRQLANLADNFAVRIYDTRLAYAEPLPRSRAKIGAPIVSDATPPNFIRYWPQFDVLLMPKPGWVKLWAFLTKDAPLFSIELDAMELDVVPIGEDV